MKKTIRTIITLAIIATIALGTVTLASAYDSYDRGYVTLDTPVTSSGKITVGDHFWTGTIGSAESTGTLCIATDASDMVTWTLKDGVLILHSHDVTNIFGSIQFKGISTGIGNNSPFWNNEQIETVIIDSGVECLGGGHLFKFGLPNLKTVITLGDAYFCTSGQRTMYNQPTNHAFPEDHEINFVWESQDFDDKDASTHAPAVGSCLDYHKDKTENQHFPNDRAGYLAAAAPIVANAMLTQEAINMLPTDLVAAVNAIGGFKNAAGATTGTTVDASAAVTPADITVTVNGAPVVWTDAAPFIDANSRTMVPLRAVADAMTLNVNWDAAAREAGFTDTSKGIYFPIDSTSARTSDGGTVTMDTAAVIASERTYAPIRYLAENFGYTVNWDGATRTVIITG